MPEVYVRLRREVNNAPKVMHRASPALARKLSSANSLIGVSTKQKYVLI